MQILCRFRKKACLFKFFLYERTLLENCIRHSSKCTNGYFLSYIDLQVRDAAGETLLSLNQHDLLGQASFTAGLLWPMYFSHFRPKTALQFLLDGQDLKQITRYFFIFTWIRKPRFWTFTMFGEITVYKQNCTIASGVKDCGLLYFPFTTFFFPSYQLDKRMNGRLLPLFLPDSSVERSRVNVQFKKYSLLCTFDFFVKFYICQLDKSMMVPSLSPFWVLLQLCSSRLTASLYLAAHFELLLGADWKILSIHKIKVFLFWCKFHVSYCFTT